MDATDLLGIVVEQGYYVVGILGLDADLFTDLSLNGFAVRLIEIGAEQRPVHGIDVSSDADGPIPDESCLAGPLASDVSEALAIAGHDDIGDELLERGVLLRLRSRNEARSALGEKGAKIPLDIEIQAVKAPHRIEDSPFNNQYLLFLGHATTPSAC